MRSLAGLAAVLACAAAAPGASSRAMSAEELHRYCAGLMYAERSSRGRSAVNWHIYDYCTRQHG